MNVEELDWSAQNYNQLNGNKCLPGSHFAYSLDYAYDKLSERYQYQFTKHSLDIISHIAI